MNIPLDIDSTEFPDRVAILRGGASNEREISLKSGEAVKEALESYPCDVISFDTSKDLGQKLLERSIDVVFLALHGKCGEDGTIQALLDWIEIPYTGPGRAASALCMDKVRSRQVFDSIGIPSPCWFTLQKDSSITKKQNFRKYIVKPRREGSSLGMSIIENGGFEDAVNEAFEYDDTIMVEEYISGYEVTVGVFGGDETVILPPVGIRPSHDFFDYDTKYTKGLTEYDVPAKLSKSQKEKLVNTTKMVAKETDTESLCRVDYILSDDGVPRILEINTIPGLTETSLLPKAGRQAGYSFKELIGSLILNSSRDEQCQVE